MNRTDPPGLTIQVVNCVKKFFAGLLASRREPPGSTKIDASLGAAFFSYRKTVGDTAKKPENKESNIPIEPLWEIITKAIVFAADDSLGESKQDEFSSKLRFHGTQAFSQAGKDGIDPAHKQRLLKSGYVLLSLSKLVGKNFNTVFGANLLTPGDIDDD